MLSLRKHKEQVEIISGNTKKRRKNFVVENGVVIIEKPTQGRGKTGWMPKYNESCFYYWRNFFGQLKRKLMVFEGASHCIEFNSEDKEAKAYPVTIETLKQWFEAKLLAHAGQSTQNIKVPMVLYLLVGAVLAMQLFQFLTMQGIIRP